MYTIPINKMINNMINKTKTVLYTSGGNSDLMMLKCIYNAWGAFVSLKLSNIEVKCCRNNQTLTVRNHGNTKDNNLLSSPEIPLDKKKISADC